MSNFFVIGLPRSRTAWLSNFLTYDDNFCYHEGIDGCSTIEEYKDKLGENKGDSSTGLMLFDMNKEFPDSPKVIIEGSVDKAIEFTKEVYGVYEPEYFYELKDKLDSIKGLRIKFEDINNSLEQIWEHLIGTPYDKERGSLLKDMNIQTNNYFNYDLESMGRLVWRGQQ